MSSCRVDVKLGGDAGFLQGDEESCGIEAVLAVVLRDGDERRRCLGCDSDELVQLRQVALVRQIGRIDRHQKIGSRALLVHGIDRFVAGLVPVGACENRHVAAGREAENADAVRVDAPFCRVMAGEPNGALSVLKSGAIEVYRVTPWNPILEHDCRDSDGVEPLCDLGAFEIPGEHFVSTAGADDNRAATGCPGRCPVNRDGGIRHRQDALDFSAALRGLVLGRFDRPCFAGCCAGPESNLFRRGQRTRGEGNEDYERPGCREKRFAHGCLAPRVPFGFSSSKT